MMRFFFAGLFFCVSCTPLLDFDALGAGEEEAPDTETQDRGCSSPADCDDGIDCTIERCSEGGVCLEPWPDNDRCGHLEKCLRGSGCVPTGAECETKKECDDAIACTEDSCVLGKCRHAPDDGACASSDPCIVDRVCDADQGCVGGVLKNCDDARPVPDMTCKIAKCDPEDGSCSLVDLVAGADDDSDGYFDPKACEVAADAADCDDADAGIHPGGEEVCDLRDNDCDGFADLAFEAAPAIIDSGDEGALVGADLVQGDDGIAVVWQKSDGQIFARVVADAGQALSAPSELTARSPSLSGFAPAVLPGEQGYLAVWLSGPDEPAAVELIGFSLDSASNTIDAWESAVTLWDAEPRPSAPLRAYHFGGEPRIAFVGKFGDATEAVVSMALETQDQAVVSAVVGKEAASIEGFDIAATQQEIAVVVGRSVEDDGAFDFEVFAAVLSAGAPQTSALERFSKAQRGALDPSRDPRVTPVSAGGFLVAFSDVAYDEEAAGPEDDIDIRGGFMGGGGDHLIDIAADAGTGANLVNQRCLGLTASGEDTGLLFSQEFPALGAVTLDFRILDADGTQRPAQAGRLARLEGGAALVGARLVAAPQGFAAAWITREPGVGDFLWLGSFKGCAAPPR